MTYGSFLYPPQIHLEQEEPLNLDEENDMIEGSLLNKSSSKYLIPLSPMSFYVILINFCKANFYVTCHSSDQDSRGPLGQNGSVEDRGSFHKSFGRNFMHTWCILKNFC